MQLPNNTSYLSKFYILHYYRNMQQKMLRLLSKIILVIMVLLFSSWHPPAGTTLLAEKTFTRQFNSNAVTVKASQERVVNKFYKGYRLKEVKTFYHVLFSIKLNDDLEIKNCMQVPIKKNQHFETLISKFKMVFSPDNQAFAIGIDNSIFAIYHFLDKHTVFSSQNYYRDEKKLSATQNHITLFPALDWQVFPANEPLFDSIILRIARSNASNGEIYAPLLRTAIQKRPIGSSTDFVLIKNWKTAVAIKYFSAKRVDSLCALVPEWKKIAITNTLNEIQKFHKQANKQKEKMPISAYSGYGKAKELLFKINDKTTYNTADCLLVNTNFTCKKTRTAYFTIRIENKNFPLNKKYYEQFISDTLRQY